MDKSHFFWQIYSYMFLLSHYQSWPRHLSLPPWNQSVPWSEGF
jgi:hypothetical protein